MKDPAVEITWPVPKQVRAKVKQGQEVFFATSGKNGAFYGRGIIRTDVFRGDERPGELAFAIDKAKFEKDKYWVIVDITERFARPVPVVDSRQVAGLAGMAIFGKFQQIGMFVVTDEESAFLIKFLDENKSYPML